MVQGSAGTHIPGTLDLNSGVRTSFMTFISSRLLNVLNTLTLVPYFSGSPSWGACQAQKDKWGLCSILQGTFVSRWCSHHSNDSLEAMRPLVVAGHRIGTNIWAGTGELQLRAPVRIHLSFKNGCFRNEEFV